MELHQAQSRMKLLEEEIIGQEKEVPSCYAAFALHNICFELQDISLHPCFLILNGYILTIINYFEDQPIQGVHH